MKKITFAFFTQETWIVPSISSLPLMVWNKPSFLPNHTEKLHSTPYNSGKIHMQKTNLFTLSQLPLREQNESIFCSPILSNFRNFGAIQLWKDLHTKDKPIYLITTAFHWKNKIIRSRSNNWFWNYEYKFSRIFCPIIELWNDSHAKNELIHFITTVIERTKWINILLKGSNKQFRN